MKERIVNLSKAGIILLALAFWLPSIAAIENTGKSLIVTGGDTSELYEAMVIAEDEAIPQIIVGPGTWDFSADNYGGAIVIDNWTGSISGQSKAGTILLPDYGSQLFLIRGSSDVKIARMTIRAHEYHDSRNLAAISVMAPQRCDEKSNIFLNVDRVRLENNVYESANGYEEVGSFGWLVKYGSFHEGGGSPCTFEDLRQVTGRLTINRSETDSKLALIATTAGGAKIAITDNEVTSQTLYWPNAAVYVVDASTELTMLRNKLPAPNYDEKSPGMGLLDANYTLDWDLGDPTDAALRMAVGFNIKGNTGGKVSIYESEGRTTPITAVVTDNRQEIYDPGNYANCIFVAGLGISLTYIGNKCDIPETANGYEYGGIALEQGVTATINQPTLEVFDYGASSALVFDKNGVNAF